MKQRLLVFDGRTLRSESVEAPGRLRWVSWDPSDSDGSALIVGDHGAMLSYKGGKFTLVDARTRANLRCVEFSPRGGTALVCGNGGTVLATSLTSSEPLKAFSARENLRRVGWSRAGDTALVVGNGGAACVLRPGESLEKVFGAAANLRSVAWNPTGGYALVCSNCFQGSMGGLVPSPNLFRFDAESDTLVELQSVSESRADLTAATWRPDGTSCLLVGFDQTWNTTACFSYDGARLSKLAWEAKNVFPSSCVWHPSGEYALVGTCPMRSGEGDCSLYRIDSGEREEVSKISDLSEFGVSCIAWAHDGSRAYLAGASSERAYSV